MTRLQAAGQAVVDQRRFRPNIVLAGVEAHDEDRIGVWRIDTGHGVAQLENVKPCARCPIPTSIRTRPSPRRPWATRCRPTARIRA
jgi:uncharacterized protein YcbX